MAVKQYSKVFDMQYWSQADEKWRSNYTSCGNTMKVEGCVITSAAMIFAFYGNKVDPEILQQQLKAVDGKADCPFDWAVAQKKYGHKYSGKFTGTFEKLKKDMMDCVINKGIPLMVRVPNHTVAIRGFSGLIEVVDGFPRFELITPSMFLVHDPGNSKNKNLQDVIDQRGEFEYYNYYTK
ncbi:C39 family peptidase [Brevibacillus brevis]|uniref:C39 family peptidase n=1 Tax=Brevibacillus brevis TaxID=1393 RepID=UPI0007D89B07|nr:C39 family peptidase [Brevibacillus brevis]